MKLATLGPLIKHGSAKDIYLLGDPSDNSDIAFRFTDWFSVFDVGRASYPIPSKGKAVCACAVKSFMIARAIGVPTHFVEQLDEITIRVKQARIIADRNLTQQDENYVVPAEWIYRLRVAGSIERDFRDGKKFPVDYGLPREVIPATGTPFPHPVHHFTTKFKDFDRDLTNAEACVLAGITPNDQAHFWSMIDRLTGAIALELAKAGYALLDGKMECLMGPARQKMIGDVFGTPDEDRFCPLEPLKQNKVYHYSKELIRQELIAMGYYNRLKAARQSGIEDPPIPQLPETVIEEISLRYKAVARAYGKARF